MLFLTTLCKIYHEKLSVTFHLHSINPYKKQLLTKLIDFREEITIVVTILNALFIIFLIINAYHAAESFIKFIDLIITITKGLRLSIINIRLQ